MANRKQQARRAERRASRPAPAPAARPSPAPAPRRSPNPSPRPGSVAANRAAGTNKSAQNQAARSTAKARVQPRSQNRPANQPQGTRMPVAAHSGGTVRKRDVNNAGGNLRTDNVRAKNRTPAQKLERRQDRQRSYGEQTTTKASDFNFADRTKNKVGAGEVRHLRKQGYDRQSIQDAAAASGLRIGGKAQQRFDRWDARRAAKERVGGTPVNPHPVQTIVPEPHKTPEPQPAPSPAPNPSPSPSPYPSPNPSPNPSPSPYPSPNPSPSPYTPIKITEPDPYLPQPGTIDIEDSFNNENEQNTNYEQTLNITQDNDINNNVNGDGNYIHNIQDNSIRNYGGDVRTFNYQNTGGGPDSPVSAATMAGYYAPSDSHASNAARLDRQITQAGDYAKDNMNTGWIAQGAIHQAGQNAYIDPAVIDKRVTQRAEASKARAHMMGQSIYGDIFGKMPNWVNMSQ